MKVQLDNDGYIKNFVICGENPDCTVEAELHAGLTFENCSAYRYVNGELVLDAVRYAQMQDVRDKNSLRILREKECFAVVNRGELWYETLTDTQRAELQAWYRAWLDVTDTMQIPDKPGWVQGVSA